MIKSIDSSISLRFPDGSICELNDEDASELEDLTDKRDADCEFKRYDYYPGQVLSGQLKAFECAKFHIVTEEMKNLRNSSYKTKVMMKVVVEKVKVASVSVNWQCQAYAKDSDLNDRQPNTIVKGQDLGKLKMLNVFEPCTLQIGKKQRTVGGRKYLQYIC